MLILLAHARFALFATMQLVIQLFVVPMFAADVVAQPDNAAHTRVAIVDGSWHINDEITYRGSSAEGLLLNVRMVNATFEDTNPKTCPDGFNPNQNTDHFLRQIPDYIDHGIRAFTLCLQGGLPGYEGAVNSAFNADGWLQDSYLHRVRRVIQACDLRGVVVILGCYYQRQDQILKDEQAVRAGVVNVARWIADNGFTNVMLEVANEYAHPGFDHSILKSHQGEAELITLAQHAAPGLLVSASGMGNGKLADEVAAASDFLLIHFNGTKVDDIPERIADLRKHGKPIVCNEDDKVADAGEKAARTCIANGASWGFMQNQVNQYFPLEFNGVADDVIVYRQLKSLAAPNENAAAITPFDGLGVLRHGSLPGQYLRWRGVVFDPSGGAFTIDVSESRGKSRSVRWLDVGEGIFRVAGLVSGGDLAKHFVSPFASPAVIHLIDVDNSSEFGIVR